MSSFPLIAIHTYDSIIAWDADKPIQTCQLLSDARHLADQLPDKQYAINLCSNRYHFLVSFCAILIRKQTNILPPNKLRDAINNLIPQSPDTYYITDDKDLEIEQERILFKNSNTPNAPLSFEIPTLSSEHLCVINYTSGSTGVPKKHYKTWNSLVSTALRTHQSFNTYRQIAPVTLVATVPAQHMFGLETSIMLPIQQGYAMHTGTPFFPEAIRKSIDNCPAKCALITTPLHLQSCLETETPFQSVEFILSATAPLSISLAKKAESYYNTSTFEIYGCTEAGTIATRQTTRNHLWKLLDGITLTSHNGVNQLECDCYQSVVPLPDRVIAKESGYLELLGRNESMINIGGKRASFEELNLILTDIEGIRDGAFFMPDEHDGKMSRLTAFVVTDNLKQNEIIRILRKKIDPLFLPRPLYIVDSLPRSETGKLPKQALNQFYRELNQDNVMQTVREGTYKNSIKIPPDHPSLDGHFPNNPLYPGVVILTYVISALSVEIKEEIDIKQVPNVKFLKPLHPGDELNMEYHVTGNRAKFSGFSNEEKVLTGQLIFSTE